MLVLVIFHCMSIPLLVYPFPTEHLRYLQFVPFYVSSHCEHSCISLRADTSFHFSWVITCRKNSGLYGKSVRSLSLVFQIGCIINTCNVWDNLSLYILPNPGYCPSISFNLWVAVYCCLIIVIIYISLYTTDTKHIFRSL